MLQPYVNHLALSSESQMESLGFARLSVDYNLGMNGFAPLPPHTASHSRSLSSLVKVDVIAGVRDSNGHVDGPLKTGRVAMPNGIAADASNNGFLVTTAHCLRQVGAIGSAAYHVISCTCLRQKFGFPLLRRAQRTEVACSTGAGGRRFHDPHGRRRQPVSGLRGRGRFRRELRHAPRYRAPAGRRRRPPSSYPPAPHPCHRIE